MRSPAVDAINQPRPAQLIGQAIAALETHGSIEARMRQVIYLFDQRLVGSGRYIQGPPGSFMMRFELKHQVADRPNSLLEVCDGHYLWTHRQKDGDSTLTRLDVQEVFHKQRAASADPDAFTPRLSMGGLRRLLDSLAVSFEFASVEKGTLDGLGVWHLRGDWTAAHLVALLPDQKPAIEAGEPADLTRLAQHVPDHVVVSLGADDLFPYRIDYRRGARSLVTLTLFEVEFDRPLDARRFRGNPPDQEQKDVTDKYLRDNGLAP